MDKKIIVIIAAVAVVFVVATGGMFWWMKKIENTFKNQSPSSVTANNIQSETENKGVVQVQGSTETLAKNNLDGIVEWYSSSKLIPTPQIYTDSSNFQAKTWEAGQIVSGKNVGNKIVLMSVYPEGPGGLMVARFMKRSRDGILSLLDNYSNGIDFSSTSPEVDPKILDSYPAYGITINSLDFPGVLYTPQGEKMLKVDNFPVDNLDDSMDNIFFKSDLLKKAFTDPVYGDFYVTDSSKITENNSSSAYAHYGFYVKAPDGTFKVYSLAIDFMGQGDIPDVTWNDSQKNTSNFSYQGATGCGAIKYMDVVDNEVKISELVATGKTNAGETVYEYADKNTKYLKDFYQEDVNYVKDFPDIGEGKKFTKNTTYEQFTVAHVVFFWKDSFGRLVRFVNQDYFINPGGCGKPVIYLYPEKTQQVSVKVAPSGGFTKTEPDYGDGWNVVADPMSRIKNLADGETYPYLFWEGKSTALYQMSRFGFVADRENLGSLLDEKLAKLGLIPNEISDFKEYWLPKMLAENKPYYFVTFVPQRKIDEMAPLEISPQPDTIIRVMMDYKALDEKMDAPGYEIKTPERKGFTAVEWGGMLK
jgi:hypothetical protein